MGSRRHLTAALPRLAALAAPLALLGCSLYLGEADDAPPVPVDARRWIPDDAPWPQVDAWPNACFAASEFACTQLGGAACFDFPDQVLHVAGGASPASACAPPPPGTTGEAIALSGTLRDLLDAAVVPGQVELLGAPGQPPVIVVATDPMGGWSLTVPAGADDAITLRTQAPGYLDVYHPDLRLTTAPAQAPATWGVGAGFPTALDALVDVAHAPGTAMLIVDLRDCDERAIQGAVVTLASAPGQSGQCPAFAGDARVFYGAAPSAGFPVRRGDLRSTDGSGRTYLVESTPSGAAAVQYVQVWGYLDRVAYGLDDLTLLAEVPVHTFADAVTYLTVHPGG